MRFAITAVLICGAFAEGAAAESITFSGTFEENDTNAYDIVLSGMDGFSLDGSLPDGIPAPYLCGNPCDASGTFALSPLNEAGGGFGWSASFEGQSVTEPVSFSTPPIGGDIQYALPAFVPPDCGRCTTSPFPATYSGEIWVKSPDGSYLFDLAIAGSGSMGITIGNPGGSEYVIHGISGSITGTLTPVPEPGTIALVLAGAAMLILWWVRSYAGAVTAWLRSAK